MAGNQGQEIVPHAGGDAGAPAVRRDRGNPALAFTFTPRNVTEAMEIAKMMAASDIVPKEYLKASNPAANILVAVMQGAKFGLDPFQSVNSIAVINGRPSMWGDAVLGIVKQSDVYESIEERPAAEALAAGEGWCKVKRRNEPPVIRTFSMDEANRAGLIARAADKGYGAGTWVTYPGRMLQMRARAWALRDVFPDVLKGLRIREEEQDVIKDADVAAIDGKPPIRRKSESGIEPGAAEPFINETAGKTAPPNRGGGAPAGQRSVAATTPVPTGGVKVRVAGVKFQPGSKVYEITVELPDGAKKTATTFSDSLGDVANTMKSSGAFGLATFAERVSKGVTYFNIMSLEPIVESGDKSAPPPAEADAG